MWCVGFFENVELAQPGFVPSSLFKECGRGEKLFSPSILILRFLVLDF